MNGDGRQGLSLNPRVNRAQPSLRPRALYFDVMNYRPENLQFAEEFLDLVRLPNPDAIDRKNHGDCQVLFAPLGYPVDESRIASLPALRVVVSNTTGVPHVDEDLVAQRGISLISLQDDLEFLERITPVAELTIGLIVTCSRLVPLAHQDVMNGNWNRFRWGSPRMLSRSSLGIVGMGRLGLMVSRIATSMGMTVRHYDPKVPGGEQNILDLARNSDVLSVHASLNESSRCMINKAVFQSMPEQSVFVNTARGELVDELALINALETGHLRAAAVDVILNEPEPGGSCASSRLVQFASTRRNLIITPHIGGSTLDAWSETQFRVLERTRRLIEGW